jgi:hypothetical protein
MINRLSRYVAPKEFWNVQLWTWLILKYCLDLNGNRNNDTILKTLVWVITCSWLTFVVRRILTSVKWLSVGWTEGGSIPGRRFSFLHCVQTASEFHLASYLIIIGDWSTYLSPVGLPRLMRGVSPPSLHTSSWGPVCVSNAEFGDLSRIFFFEFLEVEWDWVHLVRRPLFGLLYQPRMIDEYGVFGGMIIGKGNRSTRRKPAPVPLRPQQKPDLGSNPGCRSGNPPELWYGLILVLNSKLMF